MFFVRHFDQMKRIACFDKALSIDPDYNEAWLERADALNSLNSHCNIA